MFKSLISDLVPLALRANASLQKPASLLTQVSIRSLSSAFNKITINDSSNVKKANNKSIGQICKISTSPVKYDLMEFFDDQKNWGEKTIKHGREWYLEELRLKSNVDLHKLWFVLSKERNMLLTMQGAYLRNYEEFPNPERLAKVDISMENILTVVKERDIAFNLLETGKTNHILPYKRFNSFGYPQHYIPREYLVPWYINPMWKLKYYNKRLPPWTKFYRTKLRLILSKNRENKLRKARNYKKVLMSKYPELYTEKDEKFLDEYVKEKYKIQPEKSIGEQMRPPGPDGLIH